MADEPTSPPQPELLTLAEACDYTRCCRKTLTTYAAAFLRGDSVGLRHGMAAGQYRFRRADLDAWMGFRERRRPGS